MVVIKKKELIDLPTGRISKEEAYEILIEGVSKYLNEEDIALIKKAYEIAEKHHEGQKRKSGEDYIIHPLFVAMILANLKMDADTLVAGLLHDAVEDTDYTIEELKNDFSDHVA
ncbi:MAG: bifunctional (p)ppGpp synthetase/guanosine-3',5'-bis(diphosphate) 3'-pyrophosphohydrolase, partial [Lachnospiraceae bacterium]|nr:bifunctional (p)ppGpp synthetase/guanosine-3',5'-bis(diphosphate) 3'-pyrophosphohydrolase [Lachnospiraceae bacterium]